MTLLDKFLRYISFDTTSNPESETQPSSPNQWPLLRQLEQELRDLGLAQVELDANGYLTATLPANTPGKPVVGYMAHVDTSPDASGANIKAQIHPAYDGADLLLNPEKNIWLRVSDFPELAQYKGKTLITTDGTTLLGADDKAGVAAIMGALQELVRHPELPHGEIKVAFTPDEEIGRGVDKFDVERFGAQWAYTVDGGEIGELEYENFNAAGAKLRIQGRNVHPGYAKDKMRNALIIGMEFNALLPAQARPEHTAGYEGFFHLVGCKGTVEEAELQYIIRDHDRKAFEEKKAVMQACAAFLNARYGEGTVVLELRDQYYNMREQVEPHKHIVENALKAMEKAGVTPKVRPIRGGTDGAQLSFRNLPCPNLFAGGHNFHGRFEYLPLESMEKAMEVVLNLMTM